MGAIFNPCYLYMKRVIVILVLCLKCKIEKDNFKRENDIIKFYTRVKTIGRYFFAK